MGRSWLYNLDSLQFCPLAVRGFIQKKMGAWSQQRIHWGTENKPEYCEQKWSSWMGDISAGVVRYKAIIAAQIEHERRRERAEKEKERHNKAREEKLKLREVQIKNREKQIK